MIREEGFEIVIRSDDHKPPHVHVFKAGKAIKISIGSDQERPRLMATFGTPVKDQLKALVLVAKYQDRLLAVWQEIREKIDG